MKQQANRFMFFTFANGEIIERTQEGMPTLDDESSWQTQMEALGYERLDSTASTDKLDPVFLCEAYRSIATPYHWIVISLNRYGEFIGGYRVHSSYDLAVLLRTFAVV